MAVEITPDWIIIGGKKVDMRPPYAGVPSGPYKKYYDEWLKTPEGRAVSQLETGLDVNEVAPCPRGQPAREAEAKRQAKGVVKTCLILLITVLGAIAAHASEGGNWKQPADKAAHVDDHQAQADKWKGNPPDLIDVDGVPVYRNRSAPTGIVYRKESIAEANKSTSSAQKCDTGG